MYISVRTVPYCVICTMIILLTLPNSSLRYINVLPLSVFKHIVVYQFHPLEEFVSRASDLLQSGRALSQLQAVVFT